MAYKLTVSWYVKGGPFSSGECTEGVLFSVENCI